MTTLRCYPVSTLLLVPRYLRWVICSLTFAVAARASAPSIPTIVSVVAGNAQATVYFLPSASNGGSAISYYTATAYQSGVATSLKNTTNASGSSIVVTGLTNGTAYTFVLSATNTAGTTSALSPASTTVIPITSSALSTGQDFKTLTVGNLSSGATPSGWTLTMGNNTGVFGPNGSAASATNPPLTLADLNLGNTGAVFYAAIVGAATPYAFTDPATAAAPSPFKFPLFSPNGLLLNDKLGNPVSTEQAMSSGKNNNAMVATKTYTVSAGEISANDGRAHVRLAIAPILESGGHPYEQQPYEFVQIQNMTNGGVTLYTDFNSSNASGVPWLSYNTIYYTDWQLIDWSGPSQQIKQGDQIKITIVSAGCSQGGHWGRLYVNVPPGALGNASDGTTSDFPIPYVSATGPANVPTNTNFDYTFTYANESGTDIAAAVASITLPAGTTYQGCSFPSVGVASQVVTVNLGALPRGATGSFTVTVNSGGTTGQLTLGTYSLTGDTTTAFGTKVYTMVYATSVAVSLTSSNTNYGAITTYPDAGSVLALANTNTSNQPVPQNTSIVFTATPQPSCTFTGWSGSVPGNASYTSASSTITLTASSAITLTATFASSLSPSTISVTGGSYDYNGTPQGPGAADTTVTGSAGAVTYTYAGTSGTGAAYGPSTTKPTAAGSYTVTASVAADATHTGATSSATAFSINPVASTISVTGGSYTYDGSAQGPTTAPVTGSSGTVTFSYAGTTSAGVPYGPSATRPSAAGSYTVTASVAADNNYLAATSAAATFTIAVLGPPTITMPTSINVTAEQAHIVATAAAGTRVLVGDSNGGVLQLVLTVESGTITVPNLQGATLVSASATGQSSITLQGSIAQLNAALAALSYAAAANGAAAFSLDILHGVVTGATGLTAEAAMYIFVERQLLGGVTLNADLTGLTPPTKTLVSTTVLSWDANLLSGTPFITQPGALSFVPVSGQDGLPATTVIMVRQTYSDGSTADVAVLVSLYYPTLQILGNTGTPATLNPQTSLYEQRVHIVNTTMFPMISYSVSVPNLPASVALKSASGLKADGTPYVSGITDLAPGAETNLILEYFSTDAKPFANPVLKLLIFQATSVPTPHGTLLSAAQVRTVTGYSGRIYIQFPSVSGSTYWVQYRDATTEAWHTSTVPALGTGEPISWMDNGPPKTTTVPTGSRTYQVLMAQAGLAAMSTDTTPSPAAPSATTPSPTPTVTTTASGSTSSGGGGGGAFSIWFLGALLLLLAIRYGRRGALTTLGCGTLLLVPFLAPRSAQAASYEQSLTVSAMELANVRVTATLHDSSIVLPALTPLANRTYLNGYNRVDSSGNLGEGSPGLATRTGYYGFTSSSQVNLTAGTLALNLLVPPDTPYYAGSSARTKVAPEIRYALMRRDGQGIRFGVEARVGQVDFTQDDVRPLAANSTFVTDTYPLGGVVPPAGPYAAGYTVVPFTTRIGDIPTRTVATASATIQGSRHFKTDGWLVRLGGVWRLLDTRALQVEFHGGAALLDLRSQFSVAESLGAGTVSGLLVRGSGSQTARHLGWYAGANACWLMTQNWAVVGGLDHLDAGQFSVDSPAVSVRLDVSHATVLSLGLRRAF